ncbi:hypothetical protein B0H17DRAFT_1127635 [Mycena rosella]|uniref:Uncharacterized protein n=1 Tax=Mycena rosella TaxID=1033263 RepID=A0AAD7GNC7_MYCRO|nr:hypothetical protein B0H17DRAFT_1127635 [Mycena rosella]
MLGTASSVSERGIDEPWELAGLVIEQLQRYPAAFVELHRTKGTATVQERFLSEFKRSEEGISPVYIHWVIRQIEGGTAAFVECCRNEGIAGLRERFAARVARGGPSEQRTI